VSWIGGCGGDGGTGDGMLIEEAVVQAMLSCSWRAIKRRFLFCCSRSMSCIW